MDILLTGAFGNIGSSTLQELVRQGHTVRCFDVQTKKNAKREQQLSQQFAFKTVWGDIRDAAQVADAVREQELIIHLAYMIPPGVDEHPEEARAINVDGTSNVIAAAQQASPLTRLWLNSQWSTLLPLLYATFCRYLPHLLSSNCSKCLHTTSNHRNSEST